jgi:hypothetical protein
MSTSNAHRLVEFALTITGADDDQAAKGKHADRVEFFRARNGNVFADVYQGAIRLTWPVRSTFFSRWLARRYFETTGKIAPLAQLRAAINLIEARAQSDVPEREVFVRVGEHAGRIYLDLADESWSAIEIDAVGWRVVQRPSVRFLRTPGMLPLPVPEIGGSIETLRSLVNVADEQDFVLVVAWLLAAMRCDIPKPILAIRGGAGSAKSSLVEILRGLLDPHEPPYTALPPTEFKLRSGADEAYCQAYDNMSGLTASMSDALCRFVTDGSNQPVIMNGLSSVVASADLADRCVFIDCAPISDAQRRTHADVMTAFGKAWPQILGVLLDAVAHGLRNQHQTHAAGLPRMADFAHAVTACEAIVWPSGTFRTAYDLNRAEVVEALIEADPVASAVRSLMVIRDLWEGQASDLDSRLRAITGHLAGGKNWPADPRILANTLRQLAPSLMKVGIDVKFHKSRDRDRKRLITITASLPDAGINEASVSASASPARPAPGKDESRNHVGSVDSASASLGAAPDQPIPSEPLPRTADGADARKAKKSDQPGAILPKVTRQAAGDADAKFRHGHIEVPMSGSTRRVEVVVRRKLRRQT